MKDVAQIRSIFTLLVVAFCVKISVTAQTPSKAQCAALQAQYDALVTDMNRSIGCTTAKPGKPSTPLQPIDPDGSDRNNPACSSAAQQAARSAWMAQHPDFKNIQSQLANGCWPKDPCSSSLIQAPKLATDQDDDGIPDEQEAALIQRFAPYMRFTKGEDRRPIEFTDFVAKSNLVTPNHFTSSQDQVFIENKFLAANPLAVESYTGYQGTSLLDSFYLNSDQKTCSSTAYLMYAIHPYIDDWEGGEPWNQISNAHMPGMVAHVWPFLPNSAADLPGEHYGPGPNGHGLVETAGNCARRLDASVCSNAVAPSLCAVIPSSRYVVTCAHNCIKIEYYQFFGLNDDHQSGIANHEGDLSIVTVVYDSKQDAPVAVSHWIHGIEIRYDLQDPRSKCVRNGPEKLCMGFNYPHQDLILIGPMNGHLEKPYLEDIAAAQSNTLYLHADLSDPNQANPEHPEVFVELGSHEFWPTDKWSVFAATKHSGDDVQHTFIPQNIPNLGEIEHPMGDLGKLVVDYKGYWGATSANSANQSSPGPSLHTTWNWFVHSPRIPISCKSAEN